MIYKPYYYQKYAEAFLLASTEAGLLLDMGMGKTVITLTAIEKLLFDQFSVGKVLIIAPKRAAEETWPAEIEKWDHLKDITYSLVLGSSRDRVRALEAEADIFIINRENVVWLVDFYKNRWPFDMVVIDELSSFKSSKSKRFRALKKVRPRISRIAGLTGTPSSNSLLDLWPEMYLLDMGKALGKTFTGFREEYFNPDKRNGPVIYSWKPKKNAEQEIYDRLTGLCVSMKSEDYLDLPDTLYIRRNVKISGEGQKLYKKLEQDTLLPFADGVVDAPTAAVLTGKLIQASGGAVYDDNQVPRILFEDKLDALDDLIEEANGQPVLVYYAYKHERDRIIARHPEATDIKMKNAVKDWNEGKIPLLLAHPASAGHGLNLQSGGHIIIWYGLPTSLELYQQANKRLSRPGQTKTVLIHHLLTEGTYDQTVLDKILAPKEKRQNALLEALKAKIEEMKK